MRFVCLHVDRCSCVLKTVYYVVMWLIDDSDELGSLLIHPLQLVRLWLSMVAWSYYAPKSFSVSVVKSGVFLMWFWYAVFPLPR